MKPENEVKSVIQMETAKPTPARAKVAHVDGATAESGETTRVKSLLTLAIENAAEKAMNAANVAAWRAGKREVLRTVVELINNGYITRTSTVTAWKSTDGLRLHISSAKENSGSLQPAGPTGRYWFDGENSSIADVMKNLGNVARAFNVRYYEDGSAKEKDSEIQAKLNAAAAAAAKEQKRLQLIEERTKCTTFEDYKRLTEELESL